MKQELKDKWVAALRSGEYKQGKSMLRTSPDPECSEYCCLGVLAKISDVPITNDDYYEGYIPDHICKLIDFPNADTNLPNENNALQDKLAKMNDTDNKTFDEIANWIEENIDCEKIVYIEENDNEYEESSSYDY